jgi:hypothetical protein
MKVTYKVGSIIEYRNFGDQIVQVEVDQKGLWSNVFEWDNYVHLHTLNDLLRARQEILAEQIPIRLRSFRPTVAEL